MCMVADCGAWDTCMMDKKDGTGDGEWGKEILVMGTPIVGSIGGEDTAPETCTEELDAGREGRASDAESRSEITGPVAGSMGMPPYPGMLNCSNDGVEDEGRFSMAARRIEMSPIWCCMP